PELGIFSYRDDVLLKAIYACIDLSYAGLFFPLNDAIKDKGLNTVELRYGIATAYALTGDPALLSIAAIQHPYVLTGDGFNLAGAVDAGLGKPYDYQSAYFGDGPNGDQGALIVLRDGTEDDQQALVFKATSLGMGHGHFDKLHWQFYDNDHEIVTDYGAARFLNVVEKSGGVYLPENDTWAKQTVAHNTLVVDERSHFDGNEKLAEKYHPTPLLFESHDNIRISAARMRNAYTDVTFSRTIALINGVVGSGSIVVDVLNADSANEHRYDLPLHFEGQIISSSPAFKSDAAGLPVLGKANGYQHLWRRSTSAVEAGDNFRLTWLKDNRFYTYTALAETKLEAIAAELGANDPNFN
ncbi:MAG: heparinase II/III-family protein, partial [Woeseia sp.]